METEQLTQYLTNWINKAVSNGGFSAIEARDAINALQELSKRATENEGSKPTKSAKPK